jgi:hypothetical protein
LLSGRHSASFAEPPDIIQKSLARRVGYQFVCPGLLYFFLPTPSIREMCLTSSPRQSKRCQLQFRRYPADGNSDNNGATARNPTRFGGKYDIFLPS